MTDITAAEYRTAEKVARSLGFVTAQSYADHAARLESEGAVPAGGMALTAEQVEYVRTVLGKATTEYGAMELTAAWARLRALFPATEPAEDAVGDPLQAWKGFLKPKPIGWYRTMELDFAAKHFGFPVKPDSGDWFTASDGGKWCSESNEWELRYYPPVATDPTKNEAETETEWAIEFPGGICNISFDPADPEEMLQWIRDGKLVRREVTTGPWVNVPASSPVVPAPTETGPWQHRVNGEICVASPASGLPYTIGKFNDHGDFVWHSSSAELPEGFAPFVAAEEG